MHSSQTNIHSTGCLMQVPEVVLRSEPVGEERHTLYSEMIKQIEELVEDACRKETNAFSYRIWTHHIVHVVRLGKQLAEKLGADQEIVEIAALLHDYAGIKDSSLENEHHIHGAAEAERILTEFGYPEERTARVKECILTHRGSVPMQRSTPEAECVASADAMSHVMQVPSLLHLAYVTHGLGVDEGRDWVLRKLERSMAKLCPEAKELIQEHYLQVQRVLSV